MCRLRVWPFVGFGTHDVCLQSHAGVLETPRGSAGQAVGHERYALIQGSPATGVVDSEHSRHGCVCVCVCVVTPDFEQLEVTRPEFNNHPKVKQVPSPETGLPVPYFSTRLRSTYLSISWAVILVMVGIVLLCVVSIFGLRVVMIRAEGGILPTVRSLRAYPSLLCALNDCLRGCGIRALVPSSLR